jgi:hypothetical protein
MPSLAQNVLFEDPFTDVSHWNAPASWRVDNGALTVTGGDINLCKTGLNWSNYALEFDVTIDKLMAEWVIRGTDERNCRFIQLTAKDCPYSPNALRDHWWKNGGVAEIKEEALPIDIEVGKAYHIRCEVVGNTAQTLIDGKVRGQWGIAGSPQGTIGFRSSDNEAATYRNLKVVACEALTSGPEPRKPRPRPVKYDRYLNPPFRAEWIWGPRGKLDRAFRYAFEAKTPAVDARLWITCCNACKLYVNGQLLGAGDDWHLPHVYDLKPFLREGRNVLAVAGHVEGFGAAGVLAEGNVLLADGTNIPVVSNADWRTSDDAPAGWEQPAFDDSAWQPAVSEGRHPQSPWAEQSDWQLPYLGPLQAAEAQGLSLAGPLGSGRLIRFTLKLRLPGALTDDHPARVLLTIPSGAEVCVADGYAGINREHTVAGDNTLQLSLPLRPDLWLPAGEYKARVEVPGVYFTHGADRLTASVRWVAPPRPSPLPLARRPMGAGLFTDQFGGAHHYRLDGSWLVYDGQRLCPLAHGEGAYWCLDDPARRSVIESLRSDTVLDSVRKYGLTEEPVRVRLLDNIACADAKSEAAHDFSEDGGYGGKSRLMEIGDTTYRVTDNRRKIAYFAYTMRCQKPGKPHLLVFETPNDRERYTLVRIQPPWRNVGCGPYTGRDLPCDGKPYQAGFVFYPEGTDIRLTVSRLPCELKIEPESGGAVSGLWLFEFADDIASHRAEVVPTPGPQRRIGISQTHPGYLYELYGYRYGDLVTRLASLNAFADYADFVGMNLLEFNAVNGADTSETAYYPSKIWNRYNGDSDLFRELLPIAEARGIGMVPCLTSLALYIDHFTNAPWINPLTFQIDKDGFSRRDFFQGRGNGNALPDPLRPEVQKVLLDTLREFGEGCKASPAVKGIAFRMNGKIGTCYVGYDEKATAATAGFSPWDLAEFQRDTGIKLPGWDDGLIERWVAADKAKRHDDPAVKYIPQTYDWIQANCRQQWTDWRCRRMADFIRKARDLARSFRPDWNLTIKCDMPSETPDRNILWPAGEKAIDLLRDHGFDPRLLANDPGIVLQQGYFIGGGEYFHSAGGGPYYQNPQAWQAFDYQPGLADLYRTPAGTSVEFYHNYWEENGMAQMGEFATSFWGAGMMYPRGREFFRPLLHALTTNNVQSMALFSWERGSEGHEGELRRFSRAYRAIPAVAPTAFAGKAEVVTGPVADGTLWVRSFGPRTAIVNESREPRTIRLTVPAVKPSETLYEYANQRCLARSKGPEPATVTLELEPFDLRVVGWE